MRVGKLPLRDNKENHPCAEVHLNLIRKISKYSQCNNTREDRRNNWWENHTQHKQHHTSIWFIFHIFSFIAIFGQKHFEARESFYIKMKALYAYTIFDHNVLHDYW